MTQPAETVEQPPKKMHPKALRQTLDWLVLDWILLRTTLPTPPRKETIRRTGRREYGHPAEWASDKAARITTILNEWHDYLADHRNETPPPTGSEQRRLTAAWKYLEPRIEQLCQLVEAEAFEELSDLHHDIRRTLGYDRQPAIWLNIECPACDHRAVFRDLQQEKLSCGNCGWTDTDTHKDFHVFRTLVEVIERHEPFLP